MIEKQNVDSDDNFVTCTLTELEVADHYPERPPHAKVYVPESIKSSDDLDTKIAYINSRKPFL